MHEEEVYAAWNQAVQGGHFEKIAPMWGARMCEADGICYASSSAQDVRVVSAKPLQGGMLLVGFSSGEERLFDTTSLEGPAFEPLRDEAVLAGPKVEHGFVSWADGQVDVAPEYMYEHSAPYNRRRDRWLAG